MELMEENLTHFLEQASGPLPLHIQVNIGHDVILAINYLHSNNILHRDLSSYNVLLTASHRAKVADFGMSSILGNTMGNMSRTLCPGNIVYMPPEALDEPPLYEKSLDLFSFGVLLVQIHSRAFPHPTNRFKTVKVMQPIYGEVDAKIPVPEVERRRAHIEMIDRDFPFYPIVIECLRDSERERPTASRICEEFELIKSSDPYRESKEKMNEDSLLREENRRYIEEIERLRENIEEMEQQMSSTEQLLLIRARELEKSIRTNEVLRQNEEEAKMWKQSCQDMESRMKDLLRSFQSVSAENARYNDQLKLLDDTVIDLQTIIRDREDYIITTKARFNAENRRIQERLEQGRDMFDGGMDHVTHETPNGWIDKGKDTSSKVHELEKKLKLKEEEVKNLKEKIADRDKSIEKLEHHCQALEFAKLEVRAKSPPKSPFPKPIIKPRAHLNVQFNWEKGLSAPCSMQTGSTAVYEGKVYCRPASSENIYELSFQGGMKWRLVQKCSNSACTLVTVDNFLTAVGGKGSKTLLSLIKSPHGEEWREIFPPMSIERFNVAATYSNNTLVVAGGFMGRGWNSISCVEVFDATTHVWSTANPLPYSIYSASATISNDCVYIVGGYFEKDRKNSSILACPLRTLTSEESLDSSAWYNISDLSMWHSTCINIRGKLAVVGGAVHDSHSGTVCTYNLNADNWTTVSNLLLPRSECHVAVVNNRKIVVIGGNTDKGVTDNVEIGDIIL